MYAASRGKLDCLELLIAKGAKLDATDNVWNKSTALHKAARNGHAPCVEALLKAGADARLKDKVSDGAEGRGGMCKGAWGRGVGMGLGGRGPA